MAEERTMKIEYVPREVFDLQRINDRTEIERKIDRLDAKIDITRAELNGKIDVLDEKIDKVEATLSEKIDSVKNELNSKIDVLNEKINSNEEKLNEKIDNNEVKLTGKIDEVQTVLSIAINSTNSRLDSLERALERMDRTYTFLLSIFGLILVVCTFVAPIVTPLIQKFFH